MLYKVTLAGRLALACAAGGASALLLSGYGARGDLAGTGIAPPPGALCDAPVPGGPAPHAGIVGQIRYDSGLVLRYCSLPAMYAQLAAIEQPGLVRAVHVPGGDGGWAAAPVSPAGGRD